MIPLSQLYFCDLHGDLNPSPPSPPSHLPLSPTLSHTPPSLPSLSLLYLSPTPLIPPFTIFPQLYFCDLHGDLNPESREQARATAMPVQWIEQVARLTSITPCRIVSYYILSHIFSHTHTPCNTPSKP